MDISLSLVVVGAFKSAFLQPLKINAKTAIAIIAVMYLKEIIVFIFEIVLFVTKYTSYLMLKLLFKGLDFR